MRSFSGVAFMRHVADDPPPEFNVRAFERLVRVLRCLSPCFTCNDALTGVVNKSENPKQFAQASRRRPKTLIAWFFPSLLPQIFLDGHWSVTRARYLRPYQRFTVDAVIFRVLIVVYQIYERTDRRCDLGEVRYLVWEAFHPAMAVAIRTYLSPEG